MNLIPAYFTLKRIKNKFFSGIRMPEEDRYIAEVKEKDKRFYKGTQEKLKSYLSQPEFPLFKFVEIETINRCNNNCSFCPVSVERDTREYKKMDSELFHSILDQLQELNYSGTLALFSNNEPLLEDRLFEFLKYAKEKLPNAYHYLYTNGLLLNLNKFLQLMKHLDHLYIDNYDDEFKMLPQVRKVFEYCKEHPELHHKVHISMRKKNEKLSSRGGNAPNRRKIPNIKSSCILPFEQVIIRPDGKLSLCCNDALGQTTLGDLNKIKLVDIWRNELYKKYREALLNSRKNIPVCKNCDFINNDYFNDIKGKVFEYTKLQKYYDKSL